MQSVENATPTARLVSVEPPPGDAQPERCGATGETDTQHFVVCDRTRGHDGDHWDRIDQRYWTRIEPEAVAS